jgi:hypothetical protein
MRTKECLLVMQLLCTIAGEHRMARICGVDGMLQSKTTSVQFKGQHALRADALWAIMSAHARASPNHFIRRLPSH